MQELLGKGLIVSGILATIVFYFRKLRPLGSPREIADEIRRTIFPSGHFLLKLTPVILSCVLLFFLAVAGFILLERSTSMSSLIQAALFTCVALPYLSWLVLGAAVLRVRGKVASEFFTSGTTIETTPAPRQVALGRPAFEAIHLALVLIICIGKVLQSWNGFDTNLILFGLLFLAILVRLVSLFILPEFVIRIDRLLIRRERFLVFFYQETHFFSKVQISEDRTSIVFIGPNEQTERQIPFFEFSRSKIEAFMRLVSYKAIAP